MKKRLVGLVCVAAASVLLGGCGKKDAAGYVTVGDYGKQEVTLTTVGVDEDELDELMNDIYCSFITKEHGGITDRPVKVGDTAVIDFVGKKDGVAFDGGTAQGYSLGIGSGQFIDGFEDGLVGVKPGETVELELTFPENCGSAELAGQAVVFTVTVQYIVPAKVELADMEDAVVASVGIPGVATAEQLHQYIYDILYEEYESNLQDAILNVMIDRSTFKKIPDSELEDYRQSWAEDLSANAAYYGISMEDYALYRYQQTSEDYIYGNALRDFQRDAILLAIAKKEGMKVDDDELQTWLQDQADRKAGGSVEVFLGDRSKEEFRDQCLNEKVMRYLMDNTTVTQLN